MKTILWTCDWCAVQKSEPVPHHGNDAGCPENWVPSFSTKNISDAAKARGGISDMLCPECAKAQFDAVDEAKAWRLNQAKEAKTGKPSFRGTRTTT